MAIDATLPVENQIIQWFVLGIRAKVNGFNETNCYPAIIPQEVDGADNQYIQVCPESVAKYNRGDGYQMGGNLMRLMYVRCAYFFQFNADQHERFDEAMIQAVNGMLSLIESIRGVFVGLTVFNGLVCEPVRYESTSTTVLVNPDQHVLRRDIVFSAPFITQLPQTITLTAADIADMTV